MPYQDVFGYLPLDHSFLLSFASVTPLAELSNAVAWVEKYANKDGYLYPDIVHTRRSYDGGSTFEKVPKSERPGLLHQLPATHKLELLGHPDDQEAARYGLAGFLMHMLAFLYGYRCHFHDWWLDGRAPLKSTCDYHEPRLDDAIYCLETAAAAWSGWPDRQKTVALNSLFLKTRTYVYELEWERFQAEYQVFDALYALGRDLGYVAKVPHEERIPAVCRTYGIPIDQGRVDTIVRLRNDLLHEALWDKRMPGEARSQEAFYSSIWLDQLSRRVALAVVGVDGQYVRSAWWGLVVGRFVIQRTP